jgi:hypothetical protein
MPLGPFGGDHGGGGFDLATQAHGAGLRTAPRRHTPRTG